MRRGHPGIGGWRNENPRHFWPRGGGLPRHGPPQPYPLLELPAKYGGPGPRMTRGGHHFNPHSGPNHRMRIDRRNTFGQHENRPRFPDRSNYDSDRFNYPPSLILNHNDGSDTSSYKNMISYCESRKNDQCHINSMGDIDHRQGFVSQNPKPYNQHPISPWANPPMENRQSSFDDRSLHQRPNQYHDNVEGNKTPSFTGHRPPSSDHYGSNVASAMDNSNSFSRSVDDTVDIVRRRLLNRNESHHNTEVPPLDQNVNESTETEAATTSTYQSEPQTPPVRKRIQRRRQNVQSNCDKIKNKIVHQLFKMDKEKIHKLMDNPNSSSKFEFAISSLITESQNSLDRHLRSVAEKSLCSSSTEFIHDDNNTIYEDTFLKQMQCILEPQDTVLLEDIKPLVMAELNKVLQLDEFDQRCDRGEEDTNYYPTEEPTSEHPNDYGYNDADFSKDNIPPNMTYFENQQYSPSSPSYPPPESPRGHDQSEQFNYTQPEKLFERRSARKSCDFNQARMKSSDTRDQIRRSVDEERNRLSDERHRLVTPPPVFDTNVEQLSEEEDPFADLDKQYHVAVDRNFIEEELDKQYMSATENNLNDNESMMKQQLIDSVKNISPSKPIKKEILLSPELHPATIKKEIDNQLLCIAKSPLQLYTSINKNRRRHRDSHSKNNQIKVEEANNTSNHGNIKDCSTEGTEHEYHELNTENIKQDNNPEIIEAEQECIKSETSNTLKSTISSNSRKRSTDQKPSHRKEKRKKSDVSPEHNKQILNKNIIINVNDCSAKSTEKKCDATKSIFNLFFSKDENGKELPEENKNVEPSAKSYSDKYVKRKETPKKKEHESKRKRSSSASHSTVSPKDSNNTCNETHLKGEAKNKLRTIDIFDSHPVKASNIQQAHRSAAQAPTPSKVEDKKPAHGPNFKIKRHVSTQVVLKPRNKETQVNLSKHTVSKLCQTENKKLAAKAVQTEPVAFAKSEIKSSDTFERMKQIDLEIQVLLQEKFKLYNSLETKESCSNAIQNLGMTVLNVTPIEDSKEDDINEDTLSEDAIVDDFTSMPVEELEQIALESVQEVATESPKVSKRSRRQKVLDKQRKSSLSPTVCNKKNKPANTPNISLIEQIITDDRPLEEIISLDDLETPAEKQTTVAKKTKSQKNKKSKKATKKKASKKTKTAMPPVCSNFSQFILKECCIVLKREDFSKYLTGKATAEEPKQSTVLPKKPDEQTKNSAELAKKPGKHPKNITGLPKKSAKQRKKSAELPKKSEEQPSNSIELPQKPAEQPIKSAGLAKEPTVELVSETEAQKVETIEVPDIAEQTVVSESADIQFDMLDVSEDIVIGDNCEIKSGEKDAAERELLISEEIILDNSQSSSDDVVLVEAGQSGNECRMFDYSSDETLKRDSVTVTGNADAVLAIECIENNFIAACLDGNVYHFNGEGQLLTTLKGSNLAVTCLTIVKEKYGTTVYTGSLDSRIRYYDLETGLEKGPECNVLSPIQTMDRAWDTVFVGTRTGFVLQFECKNNMLIPVSTVKFSEQSILALRALKEGPRKVLLVAARSENVTIKDAQTGLLLRTLEGPKMTVYTLLFEDGKVYCGTSSHQIHVFDYASGSHCGTHEGGKGAVCLRATGGLLFAGCYDGCVYVYREGEARPFAQLRGPGLMLLSLAVVGTKIIAGYKDRSLYIWKIPLSILKEMIL